MPAPYSVTIVAIRDWGGASQSMKVSDAGAFYVPHHIVDDVALPPIVSSTTALVGSKLFSAVPACLYNLDAFVDADGFLMLFDLAAAPVNGVVSPLKVWAVYSNQHFAYSPPKPLQLNNGCVLVFSTTAPFSLTLGSHLFASAELGTFTGEAS